MTNRTSPAETATITPYFTVQDADRLIGFLTDTFGATLVCETRYDDHTVQHARLKIGASLIMLNQSTDSYSPNVSQMHIHVNDADSTFQTALRFGATSLMEPNLRPHGERMAGITDPCGNIWWIASRVP